MEIGREPIEAIAASVGFADPERMRRAFIRRFGHSPQALRRAARGGNGAEQQAETAHSVLESAVPTPSRH
nr:helix-turn-helix domain-containing protein [Mesorhizobium albiziae]